MKVRNGFVSNSSSSSFLCNVCGEIEGGFDCSLYDLGMSECEHGHIFHNGHAEKDFNSQSEEDKFKFLKKYNEKLIKEREEEIANLIEKQAGKLPLSDWEQYNCDRNEDWLNEEIERMKSIVEVAKIDLEEMCEIFANIEEEGDWEDRYGDALIEAICETGVPEEFCPVCQKIKEYEKDPDWQKYKELKNKFSDLVF